MGLYKDSLIVFGGYDGSRHNSIYSLHLPSNHWTLLLPAVGSSVPMPRSHHAMAIRGNFMYIFGGLSNEGKLLSDLHVFDLERLTWKALNPGGSGPCARINHTGHILANFFVVFGGYDGKVRLNDIIFLNLDTGLWNEPLIHGVPPARRLGHAAVAAGDKLVIFGGDDGNKDQEMLSDLQIFDLPSMRWYSPELTGSASPPRGRALASFCTTAEDVIWLIDGTNSQKARLDEIWRLDLGHLSLWKKMWMDRAAASILRDLVEVYRKIQVRSNISSHLATKSSNNQAGMHRKRNSVAKITQPSSSSSAGLSSHETDASLAGPINANNGNVSASTSATAPAIIPVTNILLSVSPPDHDDLSPLSSDTSSSALSVATNSSTNPSGTARRGKRKTERSEARGSGGVGGSSSSGGNNGADREKDRESRVDRAERDRDRERETRERERERDRERDRESEGTVEERERAARSPKKRRPKAVSRSTSKRESSPIPIATLSPTELSPTTSPRWRDDLTFWMADDDETFESSVVTFADVLPHSPQQANNWGHFSASASTTASSAASTASNLDSSEAANDEPEPVVLSRVRGTLDAIRHSFHELSLEKDDFMRLRQERMALIAEAGNRDTTQGQELKRLHQQQKSRVTLNVGGSIFTTSITTLTKYPDSMLATMFSGRHTLIAESDGTYFIDRDGTYFSFILNYLRCGDDVVLEARPSILSELLAEARFYQLEGLKDAIQVILTDPQLSEEPIVEY